MTGPASIAATVGALVTALVGAPAGQPLDRGLVSADTKVLSEIEYYRVQTWRWQDVMSRRRTPIRTTNLRSASDSHRLLVLSVWKSRAERAAKRAKRPPHRKAWRCIHKYEGAWDANTGNGYYGGLQMSLGFQQAYGKRLLKTKGTADNWTPLEQMWVAEKAHKSGRRFHPWPSAARRCGLI